MKKLLCFSFALVLTFLTFSQNEEIWNLSLNEALSIALKNNFDISIYKLNYKTIDYLLEAKKGIYDPQIMLEVGSNLNRQPTTSILQVGSQKLTLYQSRQDRYNLYLTQLTPWGQSFSISYLNTKNSNNSKYSLYNPTYNSSLSFETSLPLLRNFGYLNTNKEIILAKIDKKSSLNYSKRLIRETLLQVENAYWNLVFANEQYKYTLDALNLAKEFQEETKKKISVGVLAPIEQISADAMVAQREEELVVSENLLNNAEDSLKLLLGVKKEDPLWSKKINPVDQPYTLQEDMELEPLINQALTLREEIIETECELEKRKINTKVAKINTLPSLNLEATITYNGVAGDYFDPLNAKLINQNFSDSFNMVKDRDYKSWGIGLVLSYPIGNRALKFNYQTQRILENEASIALIKTKETITNEVRNAFRNLKNSEKRVEAAFSNLKLQKEKLDAEKKKYDNGLSTSFNVLSYQNDYLSAEINYLKARIENQLAYSTLQKAIGKYFDFRKIEIDFLDE